MSEAKNVKAWKPHKREIEYIDSMSKLLSDESGMDKDWIRNILSLTAPKYHFYANLLDRTVPVAESLYLFRPCLFEAMKWLDQHSVQELFSGDLEQLKTLEDRYASLLTEIPLTNFRSSLPLAKEFQTYLEEESKSLIKTGHPSKSFQKGHYLEAVFVDELPPRRGSSDLSSKDIYQQKRKQFDGGLLSEKFLEKVLGPNFHSDYFSMQKELQYLEPRASTQIPDLKERLKKSLRPALGSYSPLSDLKKYLSSNKLRVPADLDDRDEALRTSLHVFSQNAFKVFAGAYRAKKPDEILQKIWKLICAMPHEHLDLIFNGHLGYFGLGEYDFGSEILYSHGQKLLLNILTMASLEDASTRSNLLDKIRENLEPVIEDFTDPKTGEVHRITYSLYQAIDLCGQEPIMTACGQLAEAKSKLTSLKATVERSSKQILKISFDRLRDINESVVDLDRLRITEDLDGEKSVRRLGKAPASIRKRFSEDFSEYRPKNTGYDTFLFHSAPKKRAIEVLFKNYENGDPRTSVRELVYNIYQDLDVEEREEILIRVGNKIWRLDHGIFRLSDPAIKYGMIRTSPIKKEGERAYILDLSFENRSPEDQLRELREKKDKRQEEIQAEKKRKADKRAEKEALESKEREENNGKAKKKGFGQTFSKEAPSLKKKAKR